MYSVSLSRQNTKIIKSISFNNVDIYYIELDGVIYSEKIDEMIGQFKNEMEQIVNAEFFALNVYGSKINKKQISKIVSIINNNKKIVRKLVIVGIPLLKRHSWSQEIITNVVFSFCNDYQKA